MRKPWMPLWVDDFLLDEKVIDMPTAAVGAYVLLLAHQWREGSIPAEADKLARRCHLAPADFTPIWAQIASYFAPCPERPERLANPRLAREALRAQARAGACSAGGRLGAAVRWGRPQMRLPLAVLPPELAAAFERFWAAYPKQVARHNAELAFLRLAPGAAQVDAMLRAIEQAKQSRGWHEDGGRYIPHPATWLDGARWEDAAPPQPLTEAQLEALLDASPRTQ